jgi:phage-related protein
MDRIVERRPPDEVRRVMGFAINDAQNGDEHPRAKALKGFGGRSVLEVVDDEDGDTYRAVYTVRFAGVIYVLHAFQKKSRRGIETRSATSRSSKRGLRWLKLTIRRLTEKETSDE